jgi:GNAT superfamily N-acetyltransferase
MSELNLPEPRIVSESQIDDELDAAIKKKLCICFPWHKHIYENQRPWHGIAPLFTALLEKDRDIIAHTAVVDTQLKIDDKPFHVAGPQNVFVIPDYRKKGVSDIILQAAMKEAEKYDFDFGLLFTSYDPVLKVYARNGWFEIENQDFYKIEDGKTVPFPPKKHKMFYPLRLKNFPKGTVKLTTSDW